MLVLALAWGMTGAWAERADRNKPLNIEADSLRYDDPRQTSVFTGQVVATKGTIVLRGARLEARQDRDGHQFALVTPEPGRRAYWRQKREGMDEYLEGEAETIEYDGKADRVRFIGRAELRRYRGATLADETQGSIIAYDGTTEVFTVDGATPAAKGASSASPGGRVRAVIAPRPPASAASAPTEPAPAGLRPSTTLGGERR